MQNYYLGKRKSIFDDNLTSEFGLFFFLLSSLN